MLKTSASRAAVVAAIVALAFPMTSLAAGSGSVDEAGVYADPNHTTIEIAGRGGDPEARIDFLLTVRGGEDNVHARQVTEFVLAAVDRTGTLVRDSVLQLKFGDGETATIDFDRRTPFEHTWQEKGKVKLSFKLLNRAGKVKARGNVRLQVRGRLIPVLQILGEAEVEPKEEVRYRFVANLEEARAVPGVLTVDWGDGNRDQIKKFDGDVARAHSYQREGTYRITVTLEPENGTKTRSGQKPVTVSDRKTMNLAEAQIASNSARDIASFRVTSEVTRVTVTAGQICIFHTKAGRWPVKNSLEGNPWVAAYVNGKLNAGTFEWLRPGQVCKSIDVPGKYRNTAVSLGPHVKHGPLAGWVPKKGETVWFFVSTHSRLGSTTTNERSEPVAIVWPY